MSKVQIVIEIPKELYMQIKRDRIATLEDACRIFEGIENGIALSQNLTNGDMIMAMFPNIEMWGESKDTLDYSLGGMIHRVSKSWWNSWWNTSYEREE